MTGDPRERPRLGPRDRALTAILAVLLLALVGLGAFYLTVVESPTRPVPVATPDTDVQAEIVDSYDGLDPATGMRFRRPHDVTCDAEGNMVVADLLNRRLVKLTRDGEVYSFVRGGKWGAGKLDAPVSAAYGPDGRLYVADAGWGGPPGALGGRAPGGARVGQGG
ncbi:MAG: hypothetical protein FDZ70_10370, partial [Actinobacteria bacterium]